MKNPRLIYRVALKILALSAFVLLLWVMTRSLFVGSNLAESKNTQQKAQRVILEISGMQKGEIRKARWQGKEVAVLYRKSPIPQQAQPNTKQPQLLNKTASRALKPDYFVYINTGDSGNCPLFYANDTFKDICSSTLFDSAGRKTNSQQQGIALKIPPHYFENNTLIIGEWKK
jgi:Rieske Fe-S protein